MEQAEQEKPRAFGTGLIALDQVVSANRDIPIQTHAGGTCGNVLSILSFLGWESYPIARMNGDKASRRVRADLCRWGVKLDFANCEPIRNMPIIIQEIGHDINGALTHRFLWSCPHCGQCLPRFRPVTRQAVDAVGEGIARAKVFFLDRVSSAALTLAERAGESGAVVMFEPVNKSDPKLFAEALRIAHIVKYADQRLNNVGDAMAEDAATLIEIQTLGVNGLRYRHRLAGKVSDWEILPAFVAPRFLDSCGSGDWCSAGLLSKIASAGLSGLKSGSVERLRKAMCYGQAMAALNCAFEGARGGMYNVERKHFDELVLSILQDRVDFPIPEQKFDNSENVSCPACP